MKYANGFHCSSCGTFHEQLPLCYGSDAPYQWFTIPFKERKMRSEISSDQCIIDEEFFYIRGCLEIPIIDTDETFVWDIWVSVSEKNFDRMSELWETEGRETKMEPVFGWLSTSIPIYPNTIILKTMIHTQPVGYRPYIELEPTNHPLAIEQRTGITMERVKEIAEQICEEFNGR